MPMPTPPPKPPRRPSQPRLAELLDGAQPARESFPDEEITRPTGTEFRAALLVRYWSDCSPEDQEYLIRLAEQYAERNRQK